MAIRSKRSNQTSPHRDRQRAWLYVAIAYALGALVLLAATRVIGAGIQNQENQQLSTTGLSLLAVFLGAPALILVWKAVSYSRRATRGEGTSAQHRLVLLAAAAFIAFAVVGAFVIGSLIPTAHS